MSAFLKQNWTSNESASQIPQINTTISIKSAADVPKFGIYARKRNGVPKLTAQPLLAEKLTQDIGTIFRQ